MKTGKVSESVLKRSVLKFCNTKNETLLQGPAVGGDCAVLRCEGSGAEALHTQTLTASEPGRMRQAVYTGANNLYCSGAEPTAALLTLMLPMETEESELRILMREANEACQELGMALAGGHTTVSEAVREPVISLTVLGKKNFARTCKTSEQQIIAESYRQPEQGAFAEWNRMQKQIQDAERPQPDMDLILAGYSGKMGTALLARRGEEELKRRFPWELVDTAMDFDRELSVKRAAQIGWICGAAAMHDVSEGGIFGALWEFCECGGIGLEADLRKIPLRQETVEICEYYGWNPYLLLSGGSVLMAVPDGRQTAERLRMEGIVCSVLGRTTEKHERLLHNGEECRFLDKPGQDEIWKLKAGGKTENGTFKCGFI